MGSTSGLSPGLCKCSESWLTSTHEHACIYSFSQSKPHSHPTPQKHTKSSNGALDPNRRGGTLLWFQGTRETWGILKYQELEIGMDKQGQGH